MGSIGGCLGLPVAHHHTYYITSSYILCHIIIHTMSHHHRVYWRLSGAACGFRKLFLPQCCYITSSYILYHIIIHTISHHHTYYVTSSYIALATGFRKLFLPQCLGLGTHTHTHIHIHIHTQRSRPPTHPHPHTHTHRSVHAKSCRERPSCSTGNVS